ncbi:MAG: galactose mutarotase [Candidatus Brocadiia bacterium]|nr:MAG: galactose mutarotase [Candidatus Brocadiia bacterium]
MSIGIVSLTLVLLLSFTGYGMGHNKQAKPQIKCEFFGKTPDGKYAYLYKLENSRGMKAQITNYGGIVVSLYAPDRKGKFEDVVLGYDNLDGYFKKETPYFGCIVGRYGNRIAKGKFSIDGKEYTLAVNNGENTLHGGIKGFDKQIWDATPFEKENEVGVELVYVSRDGEEGYPGTLTTIVKYSLTNDNELKIKYEAYTDKKTVLNLTHHGYFNLAGQGKGDILSHYMMLNADNFTPVDKGIIPTGEIRPVKGTDFDFTKPTKIGDRINNKDEQLVFGLGYDHNWVLNRKDSTSLSLAAEVYEESTGRVMTVLTTEPAIQFYAGNFLDGKIVGKKNRVYNYRNAFCLETQHYPDSPNKPEFPSTLLEPGQKYQSTTVYRFSAR